MIANSVTTEPPLRSTPLIHQPAALQQFIDGLHDNQRLDIVVVSQDKTILADVIAANVGTRFTHDRNNEVDRVIESGVATTFTEQSSDYPKGISIVAVPLRVSDSVRGALLVQYLPGSLDLFQKMAEEIALFITRALPGSLPPIIDNPAALKDIVQGMYDTLGQEVAVIDHDGQVLAAAGEIDISVAFGRKLMLELHERTSKGDYDFMIKPGASAHKTDVLISPIRSIVGLSAAVVVPVNGADFKSIERTSTITAFFAQAISFMPRQKPSSLFRSPDALQDFVMDLHVRQQRDIVVVDKNKTVLADVIQANVWTDFSRDFDNEVGLTIEDGVPRVFLETNSDYPDGIYRAVVPVNDQTGARIGAVILEQSREYQAGLVAMSKTGYIIGAVALFLVLAAVALSYQVTAAIARPINALEASTLRFAENDFEHRAEATSDDEIGQLARAFNTMAGRLKDSRTELEQRSHVLALTNKTLENEVGERERAEIALRDSERRFRDYAETASDWFYETDEHFRFTFVSVVFPVGHSGPTSNPLGKTAWEIAEVDPAADSAWRAHLADLRAHRPFRKFEFSFRSSDGSVRHWRLSATPRFDKEGRFQGYRGTGLDVSDIKDHQMRLAAIFDNVVDGLIVIDENGVIESVNPAVKRMFSYEDNEVVGRNVKMLMPEPDNARHDDYLDRYKQTGEAQVIGQGREVLARRKDGTEFPIELAVSDTIFAGRRRFVGTLRDISERKQAEETLRRQALVLEQMFDAAIITDFDGKILDWNPAAERMFGYTKAEALGMTPGILHRPEEAGALTQRIIDSVHDNGRWSGEIDFIRKDGTKGITETVVVPLHDGAGNVIATIGVNRDVTARKEAERLNENLREQVFQAQKIDALGTLAGGIAHDFNNALLPVIGLTELTRTLLPESSKSHSNLGKALIAAYHARDLVQQMLAFSRQEASERQLLDLRTIVHQAIGFLRAGLPTTIQIHEDVADRPCLVVADSTQLYQVLVNLGSNSSDAMADGGGTLTVGLKIVQSDEPIIGPSGELPSGEYVRLRVADTGCGMDEETIRRIFEPFFTTKEVGKGHGLGLSVIHGIIARHDGMITAHSRPREGACFDVFLPYAGSSSELEPDAG